MFNALFMFKRLDCLSSTEGLHYWLYAISFSKSYDQQHFISKTEFHIFLQIGLIFVFFSLAVLLPELYGQVIYLWIISSILLLLWFPPSPFYHLLVFEGFFALKYDFDFVTLWLTNHHQFTSASSYQLQILV